jgi:LuxR family maltose regulon positive regulatory protein
LELQTLGGHIAVIRAYINWIGNKREVAINAAMAALEWLPDSEHQLRCQAETLLGLTLDDFNYRENALLRALAHARECSVSHVTIFAHGCWAWMLAMQGRLRESAAACHDTIQSVKSSSSQRPIPTLSHVYATLSFVLCEWNALDDAVHYAKEAVNLARQWGQADALHFALDNLAHALFASGDMDEAWLIHNEAWKVARNTSRWFEEITISQEVEWYLALDNLEAALECLRRTQVQLDEVTKDNISTYNSLLIPLSFIQIYIAQKQFPKALILIEFILDELKPRNIDNFIIRLLTWQALAYHGSRQQDQAMSALKRALTLAAPQGYLRIFIKQGPRMVNLLRQAQSAGINPDYIDTILTASENISKTPPAAVINTFGLVEALSEREMEVLKQLAQGCTDKKIAETLVIARETVHKHLKNIYSKLDVHSRTEAIARARDLKLL